jgi:hypothetical protein
MLDSVYLEYKQSLQDAAMAATSAYRLLELTERAGQVRPDHDRPASFGFGSADPPNRPGIPS